MKKIHFLLLLLPIFSIAQISLSKVQVSEEIIKQIKKEKVTIQKKLKLVKAKNANKLYYSFMGKSQTILSDLNNNEMYILDGMNIGYDLETANLPDTLSKRLNFFKTANVLVRGTGEGYSELYFKPNYYYQLFKNKVTTDLSEYLRICSIDDQDVYAGDGEIGISWQQLGERILVREKFIKKFLKSNLKTDVKTQLKEYLYDYFFGSENTKTISEGVFEKSVLKDFKHFIKENPDSKTATMINNMVRCSRKYKSRELLEKTFDKEIIIFK